jgi:hypothetical protein
LVQVLEFTLIAISSRIAKVSSICGISQALLLPWRQIGSKPATAAVS